MLSRQIPASEALCRHSICRPVFIIAAALLQLGCADQDVQFDIKYAKDAKLDRVTVSVFGVFQDGRLSIESWEQLGPVISAPFGVKSCETVYTTHMLNSTPKLAAAVDDYAKDNGISDELLAEFVPMARGQLIMALTIVGHSMMSRAGETQSKPAKKSGGGGVGLGMRGMGGGRRGRQMSAPAAETSSDERNQPIYISAEFYSVAQHKPMATVSMKYTGKNGDEALDKFVARLRREFPAAQCNGWTEQVLVDDQRILKLVEQQDAEVTPGSPAAPMEHQ